MSLAPGTFVISSAEFQRDQERYFTRVDAGEKIVVRTAPGKAYELRPVEDDDAFLTKEEFVARLKEGRQQAREGRVTRIRSADHLRELLGLSNESDD